MMAQERVRLIAGLGNPGKAYRETRHNAGFVALEKVAASFSIGLNKQKFQTQHGRGKIEGVEAILAQPLAYMNNCGPPIKHLAGYFRISCEDLLIIHDDIDLAYGRIKIKKKGGHGGHNGLRSLMHAFGGGDFARLRIGVGRSSERIRVADHVLGRYSAEELRYLDRIITRARDAVVTILTKGIAEGMNRYNDKRISFPS
jgi:PTH1 family peptidyl-tRNA hydrolase